jgi:MFS family permease
MTEKLPKNVTLAIFAVSISWFFWGPADAYFTLFIESFGASVSQIGFLLSLKNLMPIFISIPVGLLADRISSRKIVLWMLICYIPIILTYFMAGVRMSLMLLIFALLVESAVKVTRNIALDTYIKEVTPRHLSIKALALNQGFTVGLWGIGLAFGGILVMYLEFHQLFLVALIGVIIKIFVFLRITEPILEKKEVTHTFKEKCVRGFEHLRNLDVRVRYLMMLTFLSGLLFHSISFLSLFAKELNFGFPTIGFLMGLIYSSFFFAIPLHAVTNRIGPFASMALGQAIMAISVLVAFLCAEIFPFVIFIAFFVSRVAFQLILPPRNGIIATLTPKNMQGEISGIQRFTISIANVLSALFLGSIGASFGIRYIYLVTAIAYGLMAICYVSLMIHYEHSVRHIKLTAQKSLLSRFHVDVYQHSPSIELKR